MIKSYRRLYFSIKNKDIYLFEIKDFKKQKNYLKKKKNSEKTINKEFDVKKRKIDFKNINLETMSKETIENIENYKKEIFFKKNEIEKKILILESDEKLNPNFKTKKELEIPIKLPSKKINNKQKKIIQKIKESFSFPSEEKYLIKNENEFNTYLQQIEIKIKKINGNEESLKKIESYIFNKIKKNNKILLEDAKNLKKIDIIVDKEGEIKELSLGAHKFKNQSSIFDFKNKKKN